MRDVVAFGEDAGAAALGLVGVGAGEARGNLTGE
jgi:hypothetical protein